MIDFISKYWIQELFAIIIAFMTWLFQRIRAWKKEQEVVREGIVAILHDRLYQACVVFMKQGYCSVDDRRNLESIYAPYHALGGNGTGSSLYEKCMTLPLEPEEDNTRDTHDN